MSAWFKHACLIRPTSTSYGQRCDQNGALRTSRTVLVRCPYGIACGVWYGARSVRRATYGATYGLGIFKFNFRHRNLFRGNNTKTLTPAQSPKDSQGTAGQLIARGLSVAGTLQARLKLSKRVFCQRGALCTSRTVFVRCSYGVAYGVWYGALRCRTLSYFVVLCRTVSYGALSVRQSVCRTVFVRSRNRTRKTVRPPLDLTLPVFKVNINVKLH
jgi:hypothetical protein